MQNEDYLVLEMEGSGMLIEMQYDKSSKYIFNTWFDETGMAVKKEVKHIKYNPIPLIRADIERQIERFNQTIGEDNEI